VTSTDKSMPAAPAASGGCGCSSVVAPQVNVMLDSDQSPNQPAGLGLASRRLPGPTKERVEATIALGVSPLSKPDVAASLDPIE